MTDDKKIKGLRIVEEDWLENPRFLKLQWLKVVNVYSDGTTSEPYNVDIVHRRGFDSVSVVIYYIEAENRIPMVAVRSALRPSIYFGRRESVPLSSDKDYLWIKESVAGSIEKRDRGEEDIDRRMAKEIKEETGYEVSPEEIFKLGGSFFPSHGQCSEKIHMRAVEVDGNKPEGAMTPDSPMEEGAGFEFIAVSEAIEYCQTGEIEDPKLELGFRRLAAYLGYIPELRIWKEDLSRELSSGYDSLGF